MAARNPGTGGTYPEVNSREKYTALLIWARQILERSTTNNPSALNRLRSSVSDDSGLLVGEYITPATLSVNSDGSLKIAVSEYLTGVQFSSGSGDDGATNLNAALVESTVKQKLLEVVQGSNTRIGITISVNDSSAAGEENCTITVSYNLPTEPVLSSLGQTREAANYLA